MDCFLVDVPPARQTLAAPPVGPRVTNTREYATHVRRCARGCSAAAFATLYAPCSGGTEIDRK
jgi:hypothetical protein